MSQNRSRIVKRIKTPASSPAGHFTRARKGNGRLSGAAQGIGFLGTRCHLSSTSKPESCIDRVRSYQSFRAFSRSFTSIQRSSHHAATIPTTTVSHSTSRIEKRNIELSQGRAVKHDLHVIGGSRQFQFGPFGRQFHG